MNIQGDIYHVYFYYRNKFVKEGKIVVYWNDVESKVKELIDTIKKLDKDFKFTRYETHYCQKEDRD